MAVVDDGRRIVANVVASQVALHAATGGIVPEVAARAHLRWMIPVLDEARQQAGLADWSELEAIAVTEGPGLAGSLLVGITMAKTLAWLERPAARARQPPRGPHLRRVAAGSGRAGQTGAGVPGGGARRQRRPHVPGRDADHLQYRLLGQTVDDAAGEAFDKVGRLLGLPYPGGPAIQKAAEAAGYHDREFPAGLAGRHVRLFVQRAEDGGPARGRA